jgi:hypothetical protein
VSEGNGKHKPGGPTDPPADDLKVIHLGCPSSGDMTLGAAVGFHRCTKRKTHDVRLLALGSSLATGNFNQLWCWALNAARKGRVDYFAMIHSDIEPGEFWLDELIDELEARDLDVLGVVAPIKDMRGITSTAVARDDGDTWRIARRLTMTEVYRLPETFTSEDVGGPLLLNTGLWVCRFDMGWAPNLFFTVNDRIMLDARTGEYVAQIEPEDWFASRVFHELGLKVGCTRKVSLAHQGRTAFPNDRPWGTDAYDREWSQGSFLDTAPSGFRFPSDAAGWLTEAEGAELARLAEGKDVLEVGSYCGRSTICLAQTARTVAAVDTFDGRGTAQGGETRRLFERNLKRYGVEAKVTAHVGESATVLRHLPPIYDLVFIDGSHDKESVATDAALATACLRPGGLLAFHDYGGNDFGVTDAVDEFVGGGAEILGRVGTLAVVRPPAAAPVEV